MENEGKGMTLTEVHLRGDNPTIPTVRKLNQPIHSTIQLSIINNMFHTILKERHTE